MRMFVAALVGGALIGLVAAEFVSPQLADHVTAGNLPLWTAMLAAFLGSLWGWVAKGVFRSKAD